MLTVEGLRFSRSAFQLAADWSLAAGARAAVLGPSGGGKSTLLSLIAGFEAPEGGRILWNATDLAPLPPGARPLSILFQEDNLFPHLSVFQNVGLGLDPRLRLGADEKAQVESVLDRVGLSELGARKPAALSGGQRARVAFARVLLRARPILLLDEAFSSLGPALKSEMFMLLDDFAGEAGITILMVTHDPEEAARMDQIIVVDNGAAAPPEPAGPLLADPPPALAAYLGT